MTALRFLALVAHAGRFGVHKERMEDNATTRLAKRQSLQLTVGHEDDITYFTILRGILYAPLRSQRVRRACVYLASPGPVI